MAPAKHQQTASKAVSGRDRVRGSQNEGLDAGGRWGMADQRGLSGRQREDGVVVEQRQPERRLRRRPRWKYKANGKSARKTTVFQPFLVP